LQDGRAERAGPQGREVDHERVLVGRAISRAIKGGLDDRVCPSLARGQDGAEPGDRQAEEAGACYQLVCMEAGDPAGDLVEQLRQDGRAGVELEPGRHGGNVLVPGERGGDPAVPARKQPCAPTTAEVAVPRESCDGGAVYDGLQGVHPTLGALIAEQ
jgi:hypothetical protein